MLSGADERSCSPPFGRRSLQSKAALTWMNSRGPRKYSSEHEGALDFVKSRRRLLLLCRRFRFSSRHRHAQYVDGNNLAGSFRWKVKDSCFVSCVLLTLPTASSQ